MPEKSNKWYDRERLGTDRFTLYSIQAPGKLKNQDDRKCLGHWPLLIQAPGKLKNRDDRKYLDTDRIYLGSG